jgi:hypothetical protein
MTFPFLLVIVCAYVLHTIIRPSWNLVVWKNCSLRNYGMDISLLYILVHVESGSFSRNSPLQNILYISSLVLHLGHLCSDWYQILSSYLSFFLEVPSLTMELYFCTLRLWSFLRSCIL